jgi:hypothetical protein
MDERRTAQGLCYASRRQTRQVMEIKDALTALSVLVSVGALFYAWRKDNLLRRREHADRIRRAAGSVAARIERYRVIALSYFDEIQPVITEADRLLVREQNAVVVRDALWRDLVAQRADLHRRMLGEQIEIAYVDLFGYDPRIHALFNEAIARLRVAAFATYDVALDTAQHATLSLPKPSAGFVSGVLGNELRTVSGGLAHELDIALAHTATAVVTELMVLASASDQQIVNRKVTIGDPATVFADVPKSKYVPFAYSFKGGVGRSLPVLPIVRYGPRIAHPSNSGAYGGSDHSRQPPDRVTKV